MDGQAIIAVSAAVVALTQLIKWAGLPDKRGPLAVMILSALGVTVWGFTKGGLDHTVAFDYFAGWIAVATGSAGVYGFTRSGPASLTATKDPPAGAGAEPTTKGSFGSEKP